MGTIKINAFLLNHRIAGIHSFCDNSTHSPLTQLVWHHLALCVSNSSSRSSGSSLIISTLEEGENQHFHKKPFISPDPQSSWTPLVKRKLRLVSLCGCEHVSPVWSCLFWIGLLGLLAQPWGAISSD